VNHIFQVVTENKIDLPEVLRIRMFIPDPGSAFASKNLSVFNPKIVSMFSEISGMFIPDPDLDFLPISDPVVIKAPGSRIRIRNTAFQMVLLEVETATTEGLFDLSGTCKWLTFQELHLKVWMTFQAVLCIRESD
jgi:hypothetical protein